MGQLGCHSGVKPAGEPSSIAGQPGIVRAALFALCPRCGATGLFAAPAMFAPKCRLCGCEFASHELGPRGLYVVIAPLIIGLVCAALWLDETLRPPLWLHALIWPPLVALVVVAAMRLAKVAWLTSRINREAE
ncbi:DUF983 domain-containing protein [Novosphingobium sp.]|uniref:DUF983 domain-containing protein n=1 Tax=Novosphingobium sp. TaxID=1874826 RepID=UPI00334181E8